MDRIEAMTILLAVIEKGSFSAAARDMRVPVQTISRKIADLESHLGTQLLARTTRTLALTDTGMAYAGAAKRIVEFVEEAEREAAGEFVAPKGDLVITAPLCFGRLHVVPIVSDFLAQFPEINIRLVLDDRNVNLLDDQVDMAVRIGQLPDSAMIATKVGAIRGVVCASPTFLAKYGIPQKPDDLRDLPCVSPDGPNATCSWRFRDPAKGSIFELPITPRLTTNAEAALEAAVRGVGLSRQLHYQIDEAVRAGQLAIVLDGFELEPFPVHLVHAARAQMPLKMRRFLDFAAPRLRKAIRLLGSASGAK
ncbi:LysR family transcriptional regulator [Sphingomonas sp. LaA6.9]|uniref:LysR family transcriptional regulator n=1 Tax=Sphingomonas sp. LaA6.9 TaxID=2919914 RepID=UPI001F4FCA16|nr:LysR family transcriptional regulator [Sphingomonas sp. LaA6.9]MCJ8157945.1 LysR family transcriptional regulator [Sphingomonas sp. LaA6.9]